MLRSAVTDEPDGRRHVAAGALANAGCPPPAYAETLQSWLTMDMLTALIGEDMPPEQFPPDVLVTLRERADDLWRCDHPATAATLEQLGTVLRDTDKPLAKQLRRVAHKARTRA